MAAPETAVIPQILRTIAEMTVLQALLLQAMQEQPTILRLQP